MATKSEDRSGGGGVCSTYDAASGRGEGANSDAIWDAAPVRDATSWEKVRCMLQKHSRARGGLLAAAA